MAHDSRDFKLEGALNCRELGGISTAGGGATAKGRFLRIDSPHALTEADLERLYAYGVRLAVDLRTEAECQRAPSALVGYRDVVYANIPLVDNVQSAGGLGPLPDSMGALYVEMLDLSGGAIASVLRLLAACPMCAMFNCTAGKDRTGVIAMLLLLAAGVGEETVCADYALSYDNLKEQVALQKRQIKLAFGADIPDHVFRSDPEQMRTAIDHLNLRYGGARAYLTHIGLSDAEKASLLNKLR